MMGRKVKGVRNDSEGNNEKEKRLKGKLVEGRSERLRRKDSRKYGGKERKEKRWIF